MTSNKKLQKIQSQFSRAAHTYDNESLVHSRVADYLTQHSPQLFGNQKILDIGSGTGLVTEKIIHTCQEENITHFDLSFDMLNVCKKKFPTSLYVQGDMTYLPFNDSFDYVLSSMSLQWLEDPDTIIECINSALRPGGKFSVSIVIRGTFALIASARKSILTQNGVNEIDSSTQSQRLPEYTDLRESFKKHPTLTCDRSEQHTFIHTYEKIEEPFQAIRNLGISGYSERTLSKNEFAELLKLYEATLKAENQKPHLDYRIGFFWGSKSSSHYS